MNTEDAINQILAHQHFPELSVELGTPGLLQILNETNKETAHTRLLAWLLDPANSSNGGAVLRSFLHFLWTRKPGEGEWVSSPLQIADIDLAEAEVVPEHVISNGSGKRYEGRRVDVVAFADVGGNRLPLLVVEYKVDALELENQTQDYAEWAEREWRGVSGARPTLVFISPNDRAASEKFLSITFSQLADWLENLPYSSRSSLRFSYAAETLEAAVKARLPFETYRSVEMKTSCAEAIALLNTALGAGSGFEEPLKGILRRYPRELAALGVMVPARSSLGGSAWVVKVQTELANSSDDFAQRWSPTGGSGQMVFWDLDVTRVRRQVWGDEPAIWAGLWMGRPSNGQTRLEYFVGTDVAELKKAKFAQQVADGLRNSLREFGGVPVDPKLDGTLVVARKQLGNLAADNDDTELSAQKSWAAHGRDILDFVSRVAAAVTERLNSGALGDELRAAKASTANPAKQPD